MSGLAVLNAFTMFLRESESGGVWLVQNLTTVAFAAQEAPVIADGSALAAACEAAALPLGASLAAADGGAAALAAAEAAGLELVLLQAVTTRTIEAIATDDRNRPLGRMAPPSLIR
jgi:hypothetical protein